jgi:hypothetical protein
MLVTKIAVTVGILAILVPFVVALFHEDFKLRNFDAYDWFEWTIMAGAFIAAASLVLALLAFVWGL